MNIARLIEYNTWANNQVAGQIATLANDLFEKEVGGSFPSMRATMAHMVDSDWLWLNRWKGIPLAEVPVWPSENASMLNEKWRVIRDEMVSVARAFQGSATVNDDANSVHGDVQLPAVCPDIDACFLILFVSKLWFV